MKEMINAVARRFGYQILGASTSFAYQRSLAGLLSHQAINLVLDVGANEGQFGRLLRTWGYRGRIVSFEPLASAYSKLCEHAHSDRDWIIAERAAIGAEAGTTEINIARNSVSSSLLDMLPTHSQAAPDSPYVGTEPVMIKRLDDAYSISPTDRVMLKLDVQGYECNVLKGAEAVLGLSLAVVLEMSLVPLYEGQALAEEMWSILSAKGFVPWSFEPGFRDPQSKRMLQFDGFFVRSSARMHSDAELRG